MADDNLSNEPHDYKLYVYVIESEAGPQKVGHSGDPQSRLLQLMTGHPFGLEVVHTVHHADAPLLEKIAHRILDKHKIAGRREWFKCSRADAIAAVDAAVDILAMTRGFAKREVLRSPQDKRPRAGVKKTLNQQKRQSRVTDSSGARNIKGIPDDFVAEVISARRIHRTIRATAAQLGVTRSRVERALEKAREMGMH